MEAGFATEEACRCLTWPSWDGPLSSGLQITLRSRGTQTCDAYPLRFTSSVLAAVDWSTAAGVPFAAGSRRSSPTDPRLLFATAVAIAFFRLFPLPENRAGTSAQPLHANQSCQGISGEMASASRELHVARDGDNDQNYPQ